MNGYPRFGWVDILRFQQITLHAKSQELGEVVVKGNYSGIKTKRDSIIFDVNHFKTGAEENVSDVLRRLPGMEVSETGKVKYEGKEGVSKLK